MDDRILKAFIKMQADTVVRWHIRTENQEAQSYGA